MTLRVLTLNVWNRSGPWDRRRELIRSWIRRLEPDVIGLQEILRSGGSCQADEIVDGLGYATEFACAQPFWEDRSVEFGNAVASRWPVAARDECRLPDNGDGEQRVALTVKVDAPFGELAFTSTHLNWKLHHGFVRERQVVALADFVLAGRPRGGFPPIVVGDFNAEPDSTEIRYMCGLHAVGGRSALFYDAWRVAGDGGPGTTWSNRNGYASAAREPERRIDYVFAGYPTPQGLGHVESCRVVCDDRTGGDWPSDHFGVYAELSSHA